MLIRCKIHRKGGSLIHLDADSYHFAPHPETGDHVCEVKKSRHIKTLLGIPEGYEPADLDAEDDDEDEDDFDPKSAGATENPSIPFPKPDAPDRPFPELDDLDDAALAEKHTELLGRKPHPKASREKIIANVRDEMEVQALAELANQG